MKKPRKYHLPPPATALPEPADIAELHPQGDPPVGNVVRLVPSGPPLEILEGYPMGPRPDPDRPLVPTEQEVAALPRWARMAFAARCAKRLLPLLSRGEGAVTPEYRLAVESVVAAAEQSAAAGALRSRELAAAVREVKAGQAETSGPAGRVVTAALAAAHAMGCDAAHTAVELLTSLATVRTLRYACQPRLDFDRIQLLGRQREWNDDTPVPPGWFSPMWDRTPPAWWADSVETTTLGAGGAEPGAA